MSPSDAELVERLRKHREQWHGGAHHGLTFGDITELVELLAARLREQVAQVQQAADQAMTIEYEGLRERLAEAEASAFAYAHRAEVAEQARERAETHVWKNAISRCAKVCLDHAGRYRGQHASSALLTAADCIAALAKEPRK